VVSKQQRTNGHPAARPTIDQFLASRDRMNRASAEFLKIDLETALTFVTIARQAHDSARKERNCRAARKAYDTVVKLFGRVELNDMDRQVVMDGLLQLQKQLVELGEQF
jgi:hypothetical protein